jgi:alpha-D-ribose 1-methylphosphonate 5-triphosphate diphosphatase
MNGFIIKNATIVTPTGLIDSGVVRVEGNLIHSVGLGSDSTNPGLEVIDAQGGILMPGIIDIHTDALDMEIVPRPGADIPLPVAFRELDRKMCGCGFGTVFHSLHLGYEVAEAMSRSRIARKEIFEHTYLAAQGPCFLHNKIHLRYEVTGIKAYDSCFELIEKGIVSLLSIMDHTPGQGQVSKEYALIALRRKGKTEAEILMEYEEMLSRPKIEGARLEELIRFATKRNIPVASHDDDSIEKVEQMYSLGARICEFPINLESAIMATDLGMHVVGGASNVLRGGSLSGNLSIKNAVLQRVVNVLCSDYYPPSILHAVFQLHYQEGLPLHESVNLATLNPARSAGIDLVTGSIEAGKQADLLILQLVDGLPLITHSMVGGSLVSLTIPRRMEGKSLYGEPADKSPSPSVEAALGEMQSQTFLQESSKN